MVAELSFVVLRIHGRGHGEAVLCVGEYSWHVIMDWEVQNRSPPLPPSPLGPVNPGGVSWLNKADA